MSLLLHRTRPPDGLSTLTGAVSVILAEQRSDGAIPWFKDGPWDPWNHAECLMALGVMGETEAADRGFEYLAARQNPEGAWLGDYGNTVPVDGDGRMARSRPAAFQDTNFCAYPAVALWHRHRLAPDLDFVRRYWPMVRAAMRFVLSLQHPQGDISWSREGYGTSVDDAVLAGNASIFKSLDCAIRLGELVGEPQPGWRVAQRRLKQAICCAPDRFDRNQDRSAFAMDWYYPVLSGALGGAAAWARLESRAPRFAVLGLGCRCVDHQPWVTVAESCELAMTLLGLGARASASGLLNNQLKHRDQTGAFWMGWQFEQAIVWPLERPTWTQAAAILAFDALRAASSAHDVLTRL